MTLIKSLLLGSAAGIVAVASAQAADLPTRKAAPVEYVKVCNVGGITGWTLPGSDTCVKFSGYITGQFTGGNLNTQYNWGTMANAITAITNTAGIVVPGVLTTAAGLDPRNTQRVLLAASTPQENTTFFRNDTGWSTRANFGFDMASNTAYGPLIGHFDLNVDVANGFDPLQGAAPTPNIAYLNTGYLTWAGITAGKAQSFYSFTGGGDNWANFFSPDQKGFNEPLLLAYTASFGGGFSASIAVQSPGINNSCVDYGNFSGAFAGKCATGSGGGTQFTDLGADYSYNGMRWPDIVGNLKVSQGWGSAQVSGVGHQVSVTGWNGTVQKTWGFGIDAGVSFNLPTIGAGDQILFTGAWTEHAGWYSGLPDGMWGENGAVNGNGQQMAIADTYESPSGTWAKPTIWSISGEFDHHFSPQFTASVEGSYGHVSWSGTDFSSVVSDSHSWIAGVVAHWDPVTNLDFEFELLYQDTWTAQPNGFVVAPGTNAVWAPRADGFAARFEVTRSW